MINALVLVYTVLASLHVPYTLGFSIIVLTVLIRLLLSPFTASQLKTTKKLQDLTPELSKLREKHKGNPTRIQQETMALYKKHGVNPLGGCLPTIIQLLMFPALYVTFQEFVKENTKKTIEHFNSVLYFDGLKLTSLGDPLFFGLPLFKSPSQLFSEGMILALLVPIITAALQLVQSKMMFSKAKEEVKAKKAEPDFQSTFQTQMIYLIPVTIGIAAFTFPLGLV